MAGSTFPVENGQVLMLTEYGPVRLTEAMREGLLDIFAGADGPGAARLYNSLHEAHVATGGIPRVTSLRVLAGGRAA